MEKTPNSPSFDASFWNDHWENNLTGWDIGYASPPITEYMHQYPNKEAKILIPGCGNAYEAEFLLQNGFRNITLIDISKKKTQDLKQKYQHEPHIHVICEDFYQHKGKYDVIIEQTFFCANPITSRPLYVLKTAELLNPFGKIIGVLFNREFERKGPPFGGTKEEYLTLFAPKFEVHTMEDCHNSIPQRKGSELFIHLIKKEQH